MFKLKTKWFHKWTKKQKISDEMLLDAMRDLREGLSSSKLGNGLYKVRVSGKHQGKRSSFRTIVIFKEEDRMVMVYGFAKNEKENLTMSELKHFKILAHDILSLNETALQKAIEQKVFVPIGEAK